MLSLSTIASWIASVLLVGSLGWAAVDGSADARAESSTTLQPAATVNHVADTSIGGMIEDSVATSLDADSGLVLPAVGYAATAEGAVSAPASAGLSLDLTGGVNR